jgi:hypothetical protein
MCLIASLLANFALANDLTYETVGNCIGLVKTTNATGVVTYSHAHNLKIKYSECYEVSAEIARLGTSSKGTEDLVEVFVRFDNPEVGETYSYWIAQLPIDNP